jgi:hypothetical protein
MSECPASFPTRCNETPSCTSQEQNVCRVALCQVNRSVIPVVGYFEFWSVEDLVTLWEAYEQRRAEREGVGETPTIYPVPSHCLRHGRSCRLRTLCYATEKGCHLFAGQIPEKSEMAENWPFASLVMKDWYPIYLRVVGIGGFMCAVIWVGLVIEQFSK